ncbi:hypothetical protein K6959_14860 [Bacillus aquiflavi]|uniref:hypothetical protein n=1 Tax=Bacillus aquiflavi TaxID=2672567 RepID=UPI001CA95489|nr:hypothetical protein [Bacillus aquiflavi]UAC47869.1 hypothetical protein K6959_14860 [Bacillus aquiflavi]
MEKEKFVIYDYVLYILKKWWLIVGSGLLLTAIFFAYSYVNKETGYIGEAVLYSSDKLPEKYSNQELVGYLYKNVLPEDYEGSLQISLQDENSLKVQLIGNNESTVKKFINKASKNVLSDLEKEHEHGIIQTIREDRVNYLEALIEEKTQKYNFYMDEMNKVGGTLNTESLLQNLLKEETYITDLKNELLNEKKKLLLNEPPRLLDHFVIESITGVSLKKLLLAFILGVHLGLFSLLFYKYFKDIRVLKTQN